MKIDNISRSDLDECAELYVRTFNSEPWNDHWDYQSALGRLTDIFETPRFLGLLIRDSTHVIGAVFGNMEVWYSNFHYQLKEMFVYPEYQRSGIGNQLLDQLKHELFLKKVAGIYLFTSSSNWAAKFYLKNGFNVINGMQMMNLEMK